jgi:PAS domain S-box-containing protein
VWAVLRRPISFGTIIRAGTLLAILLCSAGLTPGLDRDKNIDQYGHDTWTSQNGLPGEAVYQILQTPDGYLWLRTSAGLVRFDGVRFALVEPVIDNKPVGEPVRAICKSADGNLLIRTTSRTILYKDGVFSDYAPPAALPDGSILTLFESREHEIFIGTDSSIYVIRNGHLQLLRGGTAWINSFLEDASGLLWIGGSTGVYTYRNGVLVDPGSLGLLGNTSALAEDRKHSIWAGSETGLYEINRASSALKPFGRDSIHGQTSALLEDRQENLWIGTNSGVFRGTGGRVSSFDSRSGLTDSKVFSLYEDREGSVWVGTSAGLDRFRDTKVTTFTMQEGLPSNETKSVIEMQDGSVVVFCDGGGLARFKNGVVTTIGKKDGLPSFYGEAMLAAKDGSVWAGTTQGLVRYKDGKVTIYSGNGRLFRGFISAVGEDDESLIVTTSEPAVLRFKNGVLSPFTFEGQTTPVSQPKNYTFTIYRDPSGTLWFGTVLGLFRLAHGESPANAQQKQINFPVTSISDDHRGSLWLGGRTPGLTRLRLADGRVTLYNKQAGLFDDYASRALPDDDGNLWISSPSGIYWASRKELDDYADGRLPAIRTVVYGILDGMKTREASDPASQPGGLRARDGKLWFTTRKGVVVVNPKHLLHNDLAPPVVIESVMADGKALPASQTLEVPPGKDRIEFHYTGLSLWVPEKVRFKFQLEGYDRDWVDAGSRRVAYYTNLSPGEYHFRVIACNNDGVWNLRGATVGLILKPHFYQTGWFYGLCVLGVLFIAASAQRVYTRQLRTRAKELARVVDERTKNLQQEISERKQAQESLAYERNLLRTLIDNVPDGIYVKDTEGRFLVGNPKLAQLIGVRSPEELMGKTDFDFFPKELAQRYRDDEVAVLQSGQPMIGREEPCQTKEGQELWLQTTKVRLQEPSGAVVGVVGMGHDITSRKKAQADLAQERNLLRTLIDHMPDYIYVKDPASRFLVANLHTAEAMGCKGPEDLIGKTDFDFYPKELAAAYFCDEQAILASGQALVNHEEKTTDAAGNERWLLSTKVPLRNHAGKVVGIVGMGHDITHRKEEERETQKAREAAEAANRAKSEFLANMSHEIRTPLNGIVGMTDLALDTELTPEQQEYLETVKLSADTLLAVINDILDFSKIEAGKIDLDVSDFDLRDALESTLKTVAVRADEKGLELLCEVAPEVPEQVRGDSSRLRQVLLNLVGNAIKFTERGEVAVRVQIETFEGRECLLRFTVADTGIGIPSEKQKLIFEPFSQADSTTTRKYGGTGLGLSISTRLVEMMGGKIWVESGLGQGSEFHFTLRLGVADAKAAQGVAVSPEILSGIKVLVVDHNRTNRRILTGMLQRWGVKPVSVENGEEALAELSLAQEAGQPYEMVLTDTRMPVMDGLTLIKRIRENPRLSAAIIIMLTSTGRSGDAQRCLELGAAACLLKPIRQAELREAMANALEAREPGKTTGKAAPRPPEDTREPASVLRVLLVEDNAVNQRLAMRLLEKRGHHVVLAANGREALEAIERESFDLVLMDVQMPEMDGFEATAALRQKERSCGTHLPVIALTAHAMKGDRERCLAAGMDGYLAKPINPGELDHLLHKFAPQRKAPRPAHTLHPEPVA